MKHVNYPLGDFLIRLKNASLAGEKKVVVGRTKLIEEVAKVLLKGGYLDNLERQAENITLSLAYKNKKPLLLDIKVVSRPGLRVYCSVDKLRQRKGPTRLIISTPKGILFSDGALKKNLGGEVIAEVL